MNKKINRRLRFWRKLLNLEHWDIGVNFVQPEEMNNDDSLGEVHFDVYRRTATIYIVNPKHEWWGEQNESDIEFTLLHEVLHVKMGEISALYDCESNATRVIEEQYINDMTKAILELAKGVKSL